MFLNICLTACLCRTKVLTKMCTADQMSEIGCAENVTRNSPESWSDKISNIHRHLIDLCRVVLLYVAQDANVIVLHKVDGDSLTSEATRSADAMNVQLAVIGKIVVDDQRHLLYVDATCPHVGRYQHTAGTRTELFHDRFTFLLWHVTMHWRHCEVCFSHLLRQPVDLRTQKTSFSAQTHNGY